MNKIFIRIFILALIAIFMIMLPTSCARNSTDDEEEKFMKGNENPVFNVTQDAIIFYFPGTQPKSWPDVKRKIEEELSKTINVTLDFRWIDLQQYIQKMSVLDASDEQFDAFCFGKPEKNYPDFTKLAREGKLKDISKLINKYSPRLRQKYTEEELAYGKVDGKLYAVPSLYPHAYATYIMADDALAKKYNFTKITTYEEYDAYLKAISENEPGLVPGTIANSVDTLKLFARGSGYVTIDALQKLVYKWDDPKMKVFAWEKTPEFKETANYLIDWYNKGYIKTESDLAKVASFINYGDLTYLDNQTMKLTFNTQSGDIKETNSLRKYYLYPEKPVQRDNPVGTFFYNGSFAFPSSSTKTERALQFLDWVQQNRDNHFLMLYGIEGKDYVLDKEYSFPILPDRMSFNDRTYMYWDGSWAFGNLEYMPEQIAGSESETKSVRQFLDKNSKYAPHNAFYPNYEMVQETANSRLNKFNEFEREISRGFLTDTSQIDKFIKELDDLGSDNLVTDVQAQLDNSIKARK
jgi:putative aldouronate transport system substrate-binding protein